MKRSRAAGWLLIASGAGATSSCSPGGFQSPSVVDSVRILAAAADQPYAKPGANVTVQVLAVDGRPTKAAPMIVYWLPFVCINPPGDAYYACFSQLAHGGGGAPTDGGADSSMGDGGSFAGGSLQPGIDLTQMLPMGPSFQFTMPTDVVSTHPTQPGTTPYGLAIVFNIACAGRIEVTPIDPNNVQAPPVGCFDAQRNRLGPSDYVFGYSRVYAYDELTNANPVIDHIDVEGKAVDPQLGFQTPRCGASGCANIRIGPVVPASSQELNPLERNVNGGPLKEEIWADFFSDVGTLNDESRLLYGPTTGSVGGASVTDNQFHPTNAAADGSIWIVVHDNRGGASWATVPVHLQ